MARGFIIGATAGRTTLTGEGTQHADGQSPLLASTNPATLVYDAAYGYEVSHIVQAGIERMYGGDHPDPNVMYYLTVYNEPMRQPAEPEGVDVEGILKGLHRISVGDGVGRARAAARLGRRRAVGDRGAEPAAAGLGRLGRRLVGHRAGTSCAATASPPTSTTSCTRTRSRARRT